MTDAIVGIDSAPPEIFNFDPTPLLFHSRERGDEPLIDSIEFRKKGWKRLVLFSSFLKPGKLNIPPLKKYLSIHSKKILEIGDPISVFIPFYGTKIGNLLLLK